MAVFKLFATSSSTSVKNKPTSDLLESNDLLKAYSDKLFEISADCIPINTDSKRKGR